MSNSLVLCRSGNHLDRLRRRIASRLGAVDPLATTPLENLVVEALEALAMVEVFEMGEFVAERRNET